MDQLSGAGEHGVARWRNVEFESSEEMNDWRGNYNVGVSDSSKPVRRIKSYTAQTGYVYQYYFVGKRAALAGDPEVSATEYIFDVTSDRKKMFAVSVFFRTEAVDAWRRYHGRGLGDSEQYAAVKLRLMQGFDEVPDMMNQGRRLTVNSENVVELLESIGVD